MARKILWLALIAAACGGSPDGSAEARVGSDRAASAWADAPVVLFLGTSLTAGYGLDVELAYPALIQNEIHAAGLDYRVVNAGVSGQTSAGGLRRIDWLLREPVAVLVLELGANDGLRGLDPGEMKRNLAEIIARARAAYADVRVVIAGMEAPPNFGRPYTTAFRSVFRELARETDAALIPFLLDGVGGIPALNQADGIHPTAEGHEIVAANVWEVLQPVLVQLRTSGIEPRGERGIPPERTSERVPADPAGCSVAEPALQFAEVGYRANLGWGHDRA